MYIRKYMILFKLKYLIFSKEILNISFAIGLPIQVQQGLVWRSSDRSAFLFPLSSSHSPR